MTIQRLQTIGKVTPKCIDDIDQKYLSLPGVV